LSYINDSITPAEWPKYAEKPLRPVNWNRLQDPKDLEVWQRLTGNFWLPEKVPLSNDISSWNSLPEDLRQLTVRIFTGLTLLDTVQATVGEVSQIPDGRTEHEQAVYTNISFMQSVHARSYSSVFSTLCSTPEITEAYGWAMRNTVLQQRATKVMKHYYGGDPLKRKVAATLLSSLLLYAGFYLPLWLSCRAKLMNTADMIRLILRDKAVHGYYSGYKFQRGLDAHPERKNELQEFTYSLVDQLLSLEKTYSGELYGDIAVPDDSRKSAESSFTSRPNFTGVMAFVYYNADKALMNLGYPALYEDEAERTEPDILAALAPEASETHDFFSGSGASYVIGKTEATEESDWDF